MFVVDTNLLIYAAIRGCPEHEEARRLVKAWREGSELWFVTWPIAYEFIRVTTHRAVFDRPLTAADAWRFLQQLAASPRFGFLVETELHSQVLEELIAQYPHAAGNLLHDLHVAAVMREHGVTEIRTADTDFHQFTFLKVTNPLVASG